MKTRFIALYRAMQNNHPTAKTQYDSLTTAHKAEFDVFVLRAGKRFMELREELDQGLEDIADACPEETNPFKWTGPEWQMFHAAVEGHRFEEIYTLMAKGKDNLHLIWKELETRL